MANQTAEVERQEDARKVRADRATSRIAAAVRRGDSLAVKALLEEGAEVGSRKGSHSLLLQNRMGDSVANFVRSLGIE
jgi:hypothetical protein